MKKQYITPVIKRVKIDSFQMLCQSSPDVLPVFNAEGTDDKKSYYDEEDGMVIY